MGTERIAGRVRTALGKTAAAEGFLLVELVVAISVLSVGVLGMGLALDTSRKLSLVSERHATMTHVAQREIERVQGLPYSQIGESQTPGPHSTDPSSPNYYLVNGSPPSFEWDRTQGSSEQVDIDTTSGQVVPVQSWTEGGLSGSIYDFVTWSQDSKCAPGCPSSQDYKRITVAITMGGGLQPYPVYVSSVIADPQSMPQGGISNGQTGNPLTDPSTYCKNSQGATVLCTSPIDNGNPNSWFFHDCPATSSSCSAPTLDHTLHDTVGTVPNLLCTTNQSLASGANIAGCPIPDLMDSSPPGTTGGGTGCENSLFAPPLCNYSQDICDNTCNTTGGGVITPTCSNGTGCGTGSTSDCSSGAFSSSLVNAQSHMWVTSPLTTSMTLNGNGGISLFSSTLGAANAVVSFCVEIYDVPPSGSAGSLADLLAWPPTDLGGAGYVADTDPNTGGNWPTASSEVSYIFNFRGSNGSVTIPSGHRVGVRVWMKAKSNTSLEMAYDNPAFPAQLQLNSQ